MCFSNAFSEDELLGRETSFRQQLDSRHRFTSPEHQKLYSNREKFRDAFMRLLKQDYSMDQRAFGKEARRMFDELSDANLSWFSGLFVSELINQCWSDTSWLPMPVNRLAGDREKLLKLQKLNRRVTTPTPSLTSANRRHQRQDSSVVSTYLVIASDVFVSSFPCRM